MPHTSQRLLLVVVKVAVHRFADLLLPVVQLVRALFVREVNVLRNRRHVHAVRTTHTTISSNHSSDGRQTMGDDDRQRLA
jgi:hypothetical protein